MIISTFTLTFKITHLKKTPLSFSKFYVLIIIILLNIYIKEGNHALRGGAAGGTVDFFSDVRIPTHPSYCTKISLFLVFLVSSDHRTKQQMLHSNRWTKIQGGVGGCSETYQNQCFFEKKKKLGDFFI